MYTYKAKVMNVVDGDTFDVMVDLGFGVMLGREHSKNSWIRIRLNSTNAYEKTLRGGTTPEEKQKGLEATQLANDLLLETWIVIRTYMDEKGGFGRWLADVTFEYEDDMIDWGEFLISKGLAVEYIG